MKFALLRHTVALFAVCFVSAARAQDAADPASWFQQNPAWASVSDVALPEGASALQPTAGTGRAVLLCTAAKAPQLRAQPYLADCVVHFEFMAAPATDASVYLHGRYKVQLTGTGAGAVGPLADETGPAAGPVPALIAAAGQPGAWQTLDVEFRAPRFDEARNKTQDALLMTVKLNGKVVQSNTVQTHWSVGCEYRWDDAGGATTLAVDQGSFAIRNFSIRRADFAAVKVPAISGQTTNTAQLVDLVKQGEDTFRSFGCVECHATQRDDLSAKVGPNLFGLFRTEPRDREIMAGEGHRFTIKADRSYLQRSVRTPTEEVAIGERGPNEGKPYNPVMPPFLPTVLSDQQIDGLYAYFSTLNEPANQGPIVRLAEPSRPSHYDPIEDRLQLLVDRTVRIQRGPMEHVSARSIHIGLPNGINYTFDPRVLGIVQVWQGGLLDMTGEFTNRGGKGLKMGYESREIGLGQPGVLLAPLNAAGQPIDFSFKDAIFQDGATIRESLYSKRDHLERLAAIDAQFLGYSRPSSDPKAAPVFHYRVGKNLVSVKTDFAADGKVTIAVDGNLAQPQSFTIDDQVLDGLAVSAGELHDGRWTLPAGEHANAVAEGRLTVATNVWHAKPSSFDYHTQRLVVEPSKPQLPAGYSAETYLPPKDNYGREQLFEALGLALAPDGTLVVATRTAGIWRLVHGEWHFFAEGFFDSLGVQVEDEHGLKLVVGQKAELTRVSDTDGDGLADSFQTMSDAFSYHGNYHSYMHGPVRAPNGDYFITLNLDDASSADYEYRANGKYMGTGGGFRGWAVRVPPQGGFEPWANGLRSPAGLGFDPAGRFWYTENQGEYVGTSKLFVMKKGAFYGHPAGLVDLPGMTPDSPEIAWENVWQRKERPVVLFPEGRLANSPGNPAWDTTHGGFGPFAGQMWVGDQTQSVLMRIAIEKIGDIEQGAAIPFATGLQSGVMREVFLPDNSMLIGETGRGWQAKGGHVAALERIVWDGKTIPPTIHHVSAAKDGFELHFTVAVPSTIGADEMGKALTVQSWVYRDAPDYGSPELDDHLEPVARVELSADRKTLHIVLEKTEQPKIHPQQTARVYHIMLDGKKIWSNAGPGLDAFYTLYHFADTK